MNRLNRHDQILISRRRRTRKRVNRPKPVLRATQGLSALLLTTLLFFGLFSGLGVAAAVGVYSSYADLVQDASEFTTQQEEFQTVRVYDSTGTQLLYESVDPRPTGGDRTYIPLRDMSFWAYEAAIAAEDQNFYSNPGINVRGLTRAFIQNLQGGAIQGGSSITQQLIKNVIIPEEERTQRSYARKIKEVALALEITRRYEKDQILEWYLNNNFYGNLAYGIEAASQVYFGKSASELSLAEAAMLAYIPNAPALNPIDAPDQAKVRQQVALNEMVDAGFVTPEEALFAYNQQLDDLRQSTAERFDILTAPHFALYALDQVKRELNTLEEPYLIWKKGVTIRTTLDVELQQYAEGVAREQIARLRDTNNASNAAVVAIKNDTGEILAMVGSLDYNDEEIDGQVNVALAERQPGSSFKPYVYLTALQQDLTPATMILDVPTAYTLPDGSVYRPENYDRAYHGPVSLRQALARSYNIPAIKVMDQVGVGDALDTAHRMGVNGLNNALGYYGLNLVLGGGEITLLDHTYAFATFGNLGTQIGQPIPLAQQRSGYRTHNPIAVLDVKDSEGNVLMQADPQGERVISEEVAYLMADIMSDDSARAPAFGANTALTLPDRRVAAKTGTTNGFKDNWTMGFTPQATVGVWVGNTKNESMENVTGLTGAAPIWNQVMSFYHRGKPERWYERPPGIVTETVCLPSGLRPTNSCGARGSEIFLADNTPALDDNIWQTFEIDSETGLLANASTPDERRTRQSFRVLPDEARDWARENGYAQAPTQQSAVNVSDFNPNVALISPLPGAYISGNAFQIVGNARGGSWYVEFGAGTNPSEWIRLGEERGDDISNGVLQTFDTFAWPNGAYTIRLVVNPGEFEGGSPPPEENQEGENGGGENQDNSDNPDNNGGPQNSEGGTYLAPFLIDNSAPQIEVTAPREGELFVMETDEQININAVPADAAIDRVEFYVDGQRVGTRSFAPFNERWNITMRNVGSVEAAGTQNWPGLTREGIPVGRVLPYGDGFQAIQAQDGTYVEGHEVYAIAYDEAGNANTSERVRVYVVAEEPGG